ncbi:MAG: helix-turn-helix transcriptional regulator [Stellaceae bacterium]
MTEPQKMTSAADEILASAVLGEGWEESLQQLAGATGAGGASIVRIRAGRHMAHISSGGWAEVENAAMTGHAPLSPLRYYPEHVYAGGFRVDHDVWTDDEMCRDPYFQEFLRPAGVFFHAKLRLCGECDDRVTLTLKRRIELGPYKPSDVVALDSIVPQLRAAFAVGRRVLDAEASGMVRLLRACGEPVFELDSAGQVLRVHGPVTEEIGVAARKRRLVATDRAVQARLDRAIAKAVGEPHQPFIAAIAPEEERVFLRVIPVTGRARDVFVATAALVLISHARREAEAPLRELVQEAFGLTEREAQIATLLARGLDLGTIARRLRIGLGTVRNHLKGVFGKTGTRRQGELIALLCAMRR